ncbi:hypothetical protein F3Y22_tig00111947pilonHSYRG00159 [Hibiscus syriacus]|uniref:Uncharacterized protein n=1 Tax=Hibiscus syriacus TaxID=106335 RepID=A0A6A2XNS5_HIBSY|nr:hypothetical protein F3Y22_tig00111947pilonHSYRG00159 [Hibiscus syriacus]
MFNLCSWISFYILTVVVVTGQPTPTAPPKADPSGLYNHFDPSMVIVVMFLVGAFFLVGFLSVYIRRCNEAHAMAIASAAAAGPSSQMFRLKVTCPVCRAKLTPDSGANAEQVESCSNITELNSNNNNNSDSSPPTTPLVEEQSGLVIQINETRPKISGKFPRSNSTGHSRIQPEENKEMFTLRLPEEIRKQIAKSGRLKRTRSYDVVLGMECSTKNGEGSSRGKSIADRWLFSVTPQFVSKLGSIKSPKGAALVAATEEMGLIHGEG